MNNISGHDWMTVETTKAHLNDLHRHADKQRLAEGIRDDHNVNSISSRALLPALIVGLLGLLGIN